MSKDAVASDWIQYVEIAHSCATVFFCVYLPSFPSSTPPSDLALPRLSALPLSLARRLYDLCQATVADAQTELNEKDRLAKMGGNTAKLSRSVRQKTEQIQGDLGNLTQTLAEMERRYRFLCREDYFPT